MTADVRAIVHALREAHANSGMTAEQLAVAARLPVRKVRRALDQNHDKGPSLAVWLALVRVLGPTALIPVAEAMRCDVAPKAEAPNPTPRTILIAQVRAQKEHAEWQAEVAHAVETGFTPSALARIASERRDAVVAERGVDVLVEAAPPLMRASGAA